MKKWILRKIREDSVCLEEYRCAPLSVTDGPRSVREEFKFFCSCPDESFDKMCKHNLTLNNDLF